MPLKFEYTVEALTITYEDFHAVWTALQDLEPVEIKPVLDAVRRLLIESNVLDPHDYLVRPATPRYRKLTDDLTFTV